MSERDLAFQAATSPEMAREVVRCVLLVSIAKIKVRLMDQSSEDSHLAPGNVKVFYIVSAYQE